MSSKNELSASQRFVNKIVAEYVNTTTTQSFTDIDSNQRRLIQGYFISIDRALKKAEEERLRKNANNSNHSHDNNLPYEWNKVNMSELALDVVHYARIGLDMQEKNHLFAIPYANKKNGSYNIVFMPGYSGIQLIAEKYALHAPKCVTVELVYSTDIFKPIKKSAKNPIENYEFDITNPFDRGTVVGGFGYLEFTDPCKNILVIMSLKDILKRKPERASANFWGGTATTWDKGEKVQVEMPGWYEEMCRKTLIREVYSSKYIPRDPAKIDENYRHLQEREVVYAQIETETQALEDANRIPIDIPLETEPELKNEALELSADDSDPEF